MSQRKHQNRFRKGTSLIELLVVIVIFLVGILAIVQIFPGGFRILTTTRNNAMATQLVRAEIERLKGRSATMPEMILPVNYVVNAGRVNFVVDPNRSPNNLGPAGVQMTQTGDLLNAANENIGSVFYLSGANNTRRVVGEGGAVPAPRAVGTLFGGLQVLQFAPIVVNGDPLYQSLLSVYGNDMVKRSDAPQNGRVRPYEYFIENPDDNSATIYLPRDTVQNRLYLLSLTAWIYNTGTGATESRSILDISITVNANVAGGYASFPISSFIALGGSEQFLGVDFDSVRCARQFVPVNAFSADPYEYQLVEPTLGLILFNPTGYNYQERRNNGRRVPLVGRVNYDVYDWRIIRDEFRIPNAQPAEQKLLLQDLYSVNRQIPDGRRWAGLNLFIPTGSTTQREFILLDLDSGQIYDKSSYEVNYSIGMIRFIDSDNDSTNGLQLKIEGGGIVNASNRPVRALYQAANEWAVQVMKAASRYRTTLGRPDVAQCYAGGSGVYYNGVPLSGVESPSRIYFPPMDDGKKVTIGETWINDGGNIRMLADQDFLIRSVPADPVGLPYVDVQDVVGGATLNYTAYGYAVKNVKGASVTVRALWNNAQYKLVGDVDENIRIFEKWMQTWRRTSSTTFLVKEAN